MIKAMSNQPKHGHHKTYVNTEEFARVAGDAIIIKGLGCDNPGGE